MTEPERRLWRKLRELKPLGLHFRRQVPIGPYIADFALLKQKLVIELDGDTHGETQLHDERRTAWLADQGYKVVRFSNADVASALESVAQSILNTAQVVNSTPKTDHRS